MDTQPGSMVGLRSHGRLFTVEDKCLYRCIDIGDRKGLMEPLSLLFVMCGMMVIEVLSVRTIIKISYE
ncbi:hypothetical protein I79_019559 [Cricetulus griseus]|uniref:Uncharacterized protein n=1 Tax=Cricetulus griseus TaxID=10029 RepID=G3I7R2_CRIGR|nr:hypothetical protein I79_019559 [Cricetulus griseus]